MSTNPTNTPETIDEVLENSFYLLDRHIMEEHPDADLTEKCRYGDDLVDEALAALSAMVTSAVKDAKPVVSNDDPFTNALKPALNQAIEQYEHNLYQAFAALGFIVNKEDK